MLFSCYTFGHVININTCGKVTNTEDGDIPPQTPITQCPQSKPKACQDILDNGFTETGVYTIYQDGTAGFQVLCFRISDNDFYKTWVEYKYGFGDLTENFWLGNHQLHIITAQGWYQLRVDMIHPNGTTAYASNTWSLRSRTKTATTDYLSRSIMETQVMGYLPIMDKLFPLRTEIMMLNDAYTTNCAVYYHGTWWCHNCHSSNLNGDFGSTDYAKGLTWWPFTTYHISLSETAMKARRFIQSPPGPEP